MHVGRKDANRNKGKINRNNAANFDFIRFNVLMIKRYITSYILFFNNEI